MNATAVGLLLLLCQPVFLKLGNAPAHVLGNDSHISNARSQASLPTTPRAISLLQKRREFLRAYINSLKFDKARGLIKEEDRILRAVAAYMRHHKFYGIDPRWLKVRAGRNGFEFDEPKWLISTTTVRQETTM